MQDRIWDRDRDYDTLVTWWNNGSLVWCPRNVYHLDGIMVEIDGNPCVRRGIYYVCDGTAFGFMEWIVTDKDANPRDTHKCLKRCIDSIMNMAKSKGMQAGLHCHERTSTTQKVHKIPQYGANGEQCEDFPTGP
jgi:hypothetical protein